MMTADSATVYLVFHDRATTSLYTLSLHDALPISDDGPARPREPEPPADRAHHHLLAAAAERRRRSEEHTSELQSQSNLVCRLLLEKKKYVLGPYPPFPAHLATTPHDFDCPDSHYD